MEDKAPAWGEIIKKEKDEYQRSIDEAISRQITLLEYRANLFMPSRADEKES